MLSRIERNGSPYQVNDNANMKKKNISFKMAKSQNY
jgi:hypothetical protein